MNEEGAEAQSEVYLGFLYAGAIRQASFAAI